MKYKIYRLIKDDKTVYVGRTERKDLYYRISQHRYLKKDFESSELIEETDDPTREAYWIEYYDTFNNGWNKSKDGYSTSDTTNAIESRRKTIRVFNDTGFSKEYKSLNEGARQLGLSVGNLWSVCVGKRKTHKGYKAEYIMEVI